jgi:hypothetical protein
MSYFSGYSRPATETAIRPKLPLLPPFHIARRMSNNERSASHDFPLWRVQTAADFDLLLKYA